jgi:hypothetical protein
VPANWAASAETEDNQPQGWPTLTFENSIVGLPSRSIRIKPGSGRPPAPFSALPGRMVLDLAAQPSTGRSPCTPKQSRRAGKLKDLTILIKQRT